MVTSHLEALISDINSLANPQKSKDLSWFFKTGPDQYGAGDKFLGITVPAQRSLVKIYWDLLTLDEVSILLENPVHEYRLIALLILVKKYHQSPKSVYQFYLKNIKNINNWDLVDASCSHIIGAYSFEHQDYSVLHKLAKSTDLWERRISMVSTLFLIKNNIFTPTLDLSILLLEDRQDLIHKAVGWMLREVGKKDQKILTDFLDKYTLRMPRTTLRYAIEKFPEVTRQYYLTLKV